MCKINNDSPCYRSKFQKLRNVDQDREGDRRQEIVEGSLLQNWSRTMINFTNILYAPLCQYSFAKRSSNLKFKYKKASRTKKSRVKCWWNWHLEQIFLVVRWLEPLWWVAELTDWSPRSCPTTNGWQTAMYLKDN